MASAYSILHNYDQPVYTPDFGLVAKALEYKQNKLDTNREKLQTLYDQYSMLDIYRGVDKEYTDDRLTQVKGILDKHTSGDLSSDAFTRSLASNMDQFLDEKVINSVVSTKLFKSEMAEWEKKKEDKPELYNEGNKQYAMQFAQPWLQGEEAGQKYRGGAGFIEFVDVDQNILKEIPKIVKELHGTELSYDAGSGMFYDIVKKEFVPRDKLGAALKLAIGQKGYKQLEINAWNEFNAMPPEVAIQQTNSYIDSRVTQSTDRLKSLEQERSKDPKNKDLYDELISLERAEINKYSALKTNDIGQAENLYKSIYTSRYENNVLDAYSYAPRIIERKLDQNHFQTKKMEWEMEKFDREQRAKASKSTSEEISGDYIIPGDPNVIGKDDGYVENRGPVEKLAQYGYGLFEEAKKTFGNDYTAEEWREIVGRIPPNLADKDELEIPLSTGKVFKANLKDAEELSAITRFNSYLNDQDPSVKAFRQATKEYKTNIVKTFKDTYAKSSRQDVDDVVNIPQFNFKVVVDSEGNKSVERATEEEVSQLFSKWRQLTRYDGTMEGRGTTRKPLSPSEQETMDIYLSAMVLGDTNIPPELRREMYNTETLDLVKKGYGAKDIAKFGWEESTHTVGQPGTNPQSTFWSTFGAASKIVSSLGSPTKILSEAEDRAAAIRQTAQNINAENRSTNITGVIGKEAEALETLFLSKVDKALEASSLNLSNVPAIVPHTHSKFDRLKTLANLDKNYSSPITVVTNLSEGRPDGTFTLKYSVKVGGQEVPKDLLLTQEQSQSTGLNFGEQVYSPYDMGLHGLNAQPIDLGTGRVDRSKLVNKAKELGGTIPAYDYDTWVNYVGTATRVGGVEAGEEMKLLGSKFLNGDLRFVAEPSKTQGGYMVNLYDGENLLHGYPLYQGATRLSQEQANNLVANESLLIKNDVIVDYLQSTNKLVSASSLNQINVNQFTDAGYYR